MSRHVADGCPQDLGFWNPSLTILQLNRWVVPDPWGFEGWREKGCPRPMRQSPGTLRAGGQETRLGELRILALGAAFDLSWAAATMSSEALARFESKFPSPVPSVVIELLQV